MAWILLSVLGNEPCTENWAHIPVLIAIYIDICHYKINVCHFLVLDELSKLDDLEFDTEKDCPYADRVMQEKRQRLRSTYFKILEYYKNTQKIDQWKGIGFFLSFLVHSSAQGLFLLAVWSMDPELRRNRF